MDLFFVALNAPEESNNKGHWFSHNLSFWNLLFDAGIITSPINNALEGDVKVFGSNSSNYDNWIIGVTDLNREVVQTDSKGVSTTNEQVKRILEILNSKKVKRLVLMHSKVATEFEEANLIKRNFANDINVYGKVGQYKDTEIFQVPFHNARISYKELYYQLLIEKMGKSIVQDSKEASHPNSKTTVSFGNTFINISFVLPDSGNSITENDIDKGVLRITVAFKSYFPAQDSLIGIVFKGETYQVKYVKGSSRSDLLRLRKGLISKIGLKANDKVKFTKIGFNKYEITKIYMSVGKDK